MGGFLTLAGDIWLWKRCGFTLRFTSAPTADGKKIPNSSTAGEGHIVMWRLNKKDGNICRHLSNLILCLKIIHRCALRLVRFRFPKSFREQKKPMFYFWCRQTGMCAIVVQVNFSFADPIRPTIICRLRGFVDLWESVYAEIYSNGIKEEEKNIAVEESKKIFFFYFQTPLGG